MKRRSNVAIAMPCCRFGSFVLAPLLFMSLLPSITRSLLAVNSPDSQVWASHVYLFLPFAGGLCCAVTYVLWNVRSQRRDVLDAPQSSRTVRLYYHHRHQLCHKLLAFGERRNAVVSAHARFFCRLLWSTVSVGTKYSWRSWMPRQVINSGRAHPGG